MGPHGRIVRCLPFMYGSTTSEVLRRPGLLIQSHHAIFKTSKGMQTVYTEYTRQVSAVLGHLEEFGGISSPITLVSDIVEQLYDLGKTAFLQAKNESQKTSSRELHVFVSLFLEHCRVWSLFAMLCELHKSGLEQLVPIERNVLIHTGMLNWICRCISLSNMLFQSKGDQDISKFLGIISAEKSDEYLEFTAKTKSFRLGSIISGKFAKVVPSSTMESQMTAWCLNGTIDFFEENMIKVYNELTNKESTNSWLDQFIDMVRSSSPSVSIKQSLGSLQEYSENTANSPLFQLISLFFSSSHEKEGIFKRLIECADDLSCNDHILSWLLLKITPSLFQDLSIPDEYNEKVHMGMVAQMETLGLFSEAIRFVKLHFQHDSESQRILLTYLDQQLHHVTESEDLPRCFQTPNFVIYRDCSEKMEI